MFFFCFSFVYLHYRIITHVFLSNSNVEFNPNIAAPQQIYIYFGDNFFLLAILENMSSKKVVQEDRRKLLQKVPGSYHFYILFQLDDNFHFFFFSGLDTKIYLDKPRLCLFHLKIHGQALLFRQAVLRVNK